MTIRGDSLFVLLFLSLNISSAKDASAVISELAFPNTKAALDLLDQAATECPTGMGLLQANSKNLKVDELFQLHELLGKYADLKAQEAALKMEIGEANLKERAQNLAGLGMLPDMNGDLAKQSAATGDAIVQTLNPAQLQQILDKGIKENNSNAPYVQQWFVYGPDGKKQTQLIATIDPRNRSIVLSPFGKVIPKGEKRVSAAAIRPTDPAQLDRFVNLREEFAYLETVKGNLPKHKQLHDIQAQLKETGISAKGLMSIVEDKFGNSNALASFQEQVKTLPACVQEAAKHRDYVKLNKDSGAHDGVPLEK